jgi:hypothetical protein
MEESKSSNEKIKIEINDLKEKATLQDLFSLIKKIKVVYSKTSF